ncbi:hypothetical protein pb186bvf_011012 [Paramecium bursaria]
MFKFDFLINFDHMEVKMLYPNLYKYHNIKQIVKINCFNKNSVSKIFIIINKMEYEFNQIVVPQHKQIDLSFSKIGIVKNSSPLHTKRREGSYLNQERKFVLVLQQKRSHSQEKQYLTEKQSQSTQIDGQQIQGGRSNTQTKYNKSENAKFIAQQKILKRKRNGLVIFAKIPRIDKTIQLTPLKLPQSTRNNSSEKNTQANSMALNRFHNSHTTRNPKVQLQSLLRPIC